MTSSNISQPPLDHQIKYTPGAAAALWDSSSLSHNGKLALLYAQNGLRVFPCSNAPHPRHPERPHKGPVVPKGADWKKVATSDPVKIRDLWSKNPHALVGLPTGQGGIIVFDSDRHLGEPDGVAAFNAICQKHGGLPEGTPIVVTVTGGTHTILRMPPGATHGNGKGRLPVANEVRGDGGYIIAPGTEWVWQGEKRGEWATQEGAPDFLDTFANGDIPIAPEWLLDILTKRAEIPLSERARAKEPTSAQTEYVATQGDHDPLCAYGDERRFIEMALEWISSEKYEDWFAVGASLHESKEPSAREIWDAWSRTTPAKYSDAGQQKAWDSFDRPYTGARITTGTIIAMARARGFNGYKDERQPDPSPEMKAAFAQLGDNEPTIEEVDLEELERLDEERKAQEPKRRDYVDLVMAHPGLIPELAREIHERMFKPNMRYAITAALSVVATAASRQIRTPLDGDLHLYLLVVGETGNGKDAVLKAAKEILSKANASDMIGPGGLASETAAYVFLRKRPVQLQVIDEFGDSISSMNSRTAATWQAKVLPALRILWTGGIVTVPGSVTRENACSPLCHPTLNILAASTPGQFFSAVSSKHQTDGTLNRFVIIMPGGKNVRRLEKKSWDTFPETILDRIRDIAELPGANFMYYRVEIPEKEYVAIKPAITVAWNDDARAAWEKYALECDELADTDDTRRNIGARTAENALRLASVLAVSVNRREPVITEKEIEIGIAIAEQSYADMTLGIASHVPESGRFNVPDKILELIKLAPGKTLKRSDIKKKLWRQNPNPRELNEAFASLLDAGYVVQKRVKGTRGPGSIAYELAR